MALELRQSLNLSQQLVMTPQLQLAIKLLQLSRLELMETIAQEMETNPVLEEAGPGDTEEETGGDEGGPEREPPAIREVTVEERARADVDWEAYLTEYNTEWTPFPQEEREAPPFEKVLSTKTDLKEHLLWQLRMTDVDHKDREIGVHIIGNLDENGYLDVSLEEIARETGETVERVEKVLKVIQQFDPVGVAGRDMRECLLLQLHFQNLGGTLVERIVKEHLEDLENRKLDLIAKRLEVSVDEILAAVTVIQSLEPKPGRNFSVEDPVYIIPDIYVFKVGDDYEILLNEDGLPRLRINGYYKDVLRRKDGVSQSAKTYIQDKLRSATWLIKSIQQRQRTIYRVTESIMKFQREFLDHGISRLRPLVLRDVAEDIGMHESTVSRVTTNKYVHTPQGLFELKFFFNSSIESYKGEAVASEAVKELIRKIIKSEDKTKPYSDDEIARILRQHYLKVARRTVAKYREALGILPSRKRKALA